MNENSKSENRFGKILLGIIGILLLIPLYHFIWFVWFSQMCGPDSEKQILALHKEFVSIREHDDQLGIKYYYATSTEGEVYNVEANLSCRFWKAVDVEIIDVVNLKKH